MANHVPLQSVDVGEGLATHLTGHLGELGVEIVLVDGTGRFVRVLEMKLQDTDVPTGDAALRTPFTDRKSVV